MEPEIISETELERISQLQSPNQVVAILQQLENKEPVLQNELTLYLDGIQDPGNFGTIIRIADWFGIENIICSDNSVDCFNPKVVQSTMGSLSRVNVIYTNLEKIYR